MGHGQAPWLSPRLNYCRTVDPTVPTLQETSGNIALAASALPTPPHSVSPIGLRVTDGIKRITPIVDLTFTA
jgi:hypothetical protein